MNFLIKYRKKEITNRKSCYKEIQFIQRSNYPIGEKLLIVVINRVSMTRKNKHRFLVSIIVSEDFYKFQCESFVVKEPWIQNSAKYQ